MRQSLVYFVAIAFLLLAVGPASAQAPAAAPAAASNAPMATIGMGLSIVGIGIGLGLIGFAALSGIARQPEQSGAIQGVMFILAGLVEGAGIIAIVLCLVALFL
ncbi:MAG TPA: ATP synthase F0 subunit C [Fimbriiglobus sp.]|jgi:ATP synthase F0 subunit c